MKEIRDYLNQQGVKNTRGQPLTYDSVQHLLNNRRYIGSIPIGTLWIEDLVVNKTMKMVMDDKAIEAIVSMLIDLQDRENVNLSLYEQQLRETDIIYPCAGLCT